MILSESTLDNLVTPIATRQEELNVWLLETIAKKIKSLGDLNPSDVHKLIQMRYVGADVRLINAKLAELTLLQELEIRKLIKKVAQDFYEEAKPFYNYRHKPFIPYEKNKFLQKRVNAIARQTAGTYENISKAQAFMLRDPKNPKNLISTPIAKAYQSVVDEAIQAAQTGTVDYNTAMQRTLNQFVDSGLRYTEYESEKGRHTTQRIEVAVRRNVLDGIRAVNQKVQEITGEEFGADGVEITVHMNPAADHEEMQGHQYYKSEFEKMQSGEDFRDVKGRLYSGFPRAVGTLNCRHFAIAIIVGHVDQTYTDKQLQDILDKNKQGYTLPNGKHLTGYECTQKQREYERRIKRLKEKQIVFNQAGNLNKAWEYQQKSKQLVQEYQAFSNSCGLKFRGDKIYIKGYKELKKKP